MALVTNQRDRDQVCQLLTEAVTMLCKNMLTFSNNLCIEGLIGVTTDCTNVILVNIKETITPTPVLTADNAPYQTEVHSSPVNNMYKSPKLKRRSSNSSSYSSESQISTGSKRVASPEKPVGRFSPAEIADDKSDSVVGAPLKSIKQECDTVPYTDQYEKLDIEETALEKSCSSPMPFENNLPCDTVPTAWPNYDDAPRPLLILPESTLLPWSRVGHGLEQTQGTDAYELIDRPNGSHHLPHSNKISFAMGKDRNLLRHGPRMTPSEYAKKHGSLSFTIEHDPYGSELFICDCGEPFRHRSSLYRHQMVHLGMAYRCDLCGIIMNRKDNLLTHKRRYCLAQKQLNKTCD